MRSVSGLMLAKIRRRTVMQVPLVQWTYGGQVRAVLDARVAREQQRRIAMQQQAAAVQRMQDYKDAVLQVQAAIAEAQGDDAPAPSAVTLQ